MEKIQSLNSIKDYKKLMSWKEKIYKTQNLFKGTYSKDVKLFFLKDKSESKNKNIKEKSNIKSKLYNDLNNKLRFSSENNSSFENKCQKNKNIKNDKNENPREEILPRESGRNLKMKLVKEK